MQIFNYVNYIIWHLFTSLYSVASVVRSRTPAVVHQVRTIDLTPNNREVKMETYNPPYNSNSGTIGITDAPPAYSDLYNS